MQMDLSRLDIDIVAAQMCESVFTADLKEKGVGFYDFSQTLCGNINSAATLEQAQKSVAFSAHKLFPALCKSNFNHFVLLLPVVCSDNVPDEAVVNDWVHKVRLGAGADGWTETILHYQTDLNRLAFNEQVQKSYLLRHRR